MICEDLIEDKETYQKLVTKLKRYKKVRLISYVASSQLYKLRDSLKNSGINVTLPEAPEWKNSWTVNFYGSKSGIRQLSQTSSFSEPDFKMTEGLICSGRQNAAKIAATRYISKRGVVIKTNKGCAGNGVFIYRDGDLPYDFQSCEEAILINFKEDTYWDTSPIVIEDLIETKTGHFENFPNIEFKIDSTGYVKILYVCNCKVTSQGHFYGVDIGKGVLSDGINAKVEDMGFYVADKYSSAGYVGRFDIDMMLSKNKMLYVNESNIRYTGGSDTYKVVRNLLGGDFAQNCYVIARTRKSWLKKYTQSFSSIKKVLGPLLYDAKKKTGVILQSYSCCHEGFLQYLVIGTDKKSAYRIESTLKEAIIQLNPARGDLIEKSL